MHSMNRRQLLNAAAAFPLLPGADLWQLATAWAETPGADALRLAGSCNRFEPDCLPFPSQRFGYINRAFTEARRLPGQRGGVPKPILPAL